MLRDLLLGLDADSCRQLRARRVLVEFGDHIDNRKAGARGSLSIILVGLGIAKIGHHAVTEVLGDVATESRYRFSGRAMVAEHGLAPFLRIELRGDPGGPWRTSRFVLGDARRRRKFRRRDVPRISAPSDLNCALR